MKNPTHLTPAVKAALAAHGWSPDRVGRPIAGPKPGGNGQGGGTATADVDDITIPDTAEGLREFMTDAKKMRALFAQQGGFDEFVRRYAKTVLDRDLEIATQVKEQVDLNIKAWLKQQAEDEGVAPISLNFNRPEGMAAAAMGGQPVGQRQGLFNQAAMGAAVDKEFANSGDYFRSIWHLTRQDASLQAKLHRLRNAFSSTVPSEGGFLIPETLRSQMLMVALETAIVRPRAMVVPMESLRVPFPAIDETSHVSSVFGGIVGYWTEEGAALVESSASFGRIVLDAKKLTAYTEVPNELLSDSIGSFMAFIDTLFPQALSFYEDLAFLRGSGVGEPLGVLNGPGVITITQAGGTNNIVFADIINMFSRMLPSSLARAVWVASIDTMPNLLSLSFAPGANDISPPLWLTGGQAISGPTMQLLGRPIIFTEKVPASGAAGQLSLIDFGYYLLGDRQVMSAMSSPHYKFGNDRTAYRIIERVDGRPWLNSAITPANGSATLSPYVQLGASV
jgi:HK97 family phage major capsid protein